MSSSNVWLLMTIFELFLALHAFFCSLLFLWLICQSGGLHSYSRVYLLLVGFSMCLFSSYFLSIFEYLLAGKQYALTDETSTFRSKTWEFIHEFGVCLQSLAMLLFSIERYIAIRHPFFYGSPCFLILIYLSILMSALLSLAFTTTIHVYKKLILPTVLMSVSDLLGLSILISAWQISRRNYRISAGVESLGRRYQMSEVYSWSSILLPSVAGASIFKLLSMIPIWTWLLLKLTEWEYGVANYLYNNILNAYIVIFPWMIIYRSDSLRRQLLTKHHRRVIPDDVENSEKKETAVVKTLEGKTISMRPSQNEYFDMLKASWSV